MKTLEEHKDNIEEKFPGRLVVIGPDVVDIVYEMIKYDKGPGWVERLLNKATIPASNEDRGLDRITTRFDLFRDLRSDEVSARNLEPVTKVEILKTGLYGLLWGIAWYVDEVVPEGQIWVTSTDGKTHRTDKFQIYGKEVALLPEEAPKGDVDVN